MVYVGKGPDGKPCLYADDIDRMFVAMHEKTEAKRQNKWYRRLWRRLKSDRRMTNDS